VSVKPGRPSQSADSTARARARAPTTSSSTTRRSCLSACTRPAAGRSRAPCARRAPRTAKASPSTCPCQARAAAHPQPPAVQHVARPLDAPPHGWRGRGLSEPARRAARIARACGRRSAAHRVSGSRARAGDSGDAAMAAAFDEVVGPAAERFQPDIILARSPPARAPARAAPVACTEPAATADGRYRPELRRSRATCRRHAACAARGRRSTRARPGLAVACHA